MKKALFLIMLWSQAAVAQTEQAWVFFTEKSELTLLDTPEVFLSARAVERKQRYNVPIDPRDLPLNREYVNTVGSVENIQLLTSSKWFNGVYVEGTQDTITGLLDFDFVESVFFMNRSLNTSEETNIAAKNINQNKFEELTVANFGETSSQIEQLNLQILHNLGYTGEGMLIGVMDGGFINVDTIGAFDRAWENNQIIYGYDAEFNSDISFDETQGDHGTAVLSTMLGYIENDFLGTAIDAQYSLFKTEVISSETPKEEAFWIAAAEKADSLGVDILNTSLGYSTFDDLKYDYTTDQMDGKTTFISRAVTIALEKGMIPVTSAGNSGNDPWGIITAPADSPAALSIGAVDVNENKAGFSSVGPTADGRIKPDVVALGLGATVINSSGQIATSNGTSFSGPIMAGAVACLWQAFPEKNASEIIEMVRMSSHLYNTPNTELGYGIPDFSTFLEEIPELETLISDTENLEFKFNIIEEDLEFLFPADKLSYTFYIYNTLGKLVKRGLLSQFSSISVAELSSGLYFFRTDTMEDALKFVKQ